MADESVLEGLNPFDLLDAESARAERHFLTIEDWSAPSRCERWTARTGWRARVARFVIAELGKPVEIDTAGGRYVVRAGDEHAELSDDELVEASQARLPPGHGLTPALREALSTVP